MIAALIDTNVVLDYAEEHKGFNEAAQKIFGVTRLNTPKWKTSPTKEPKHARN